MGGWLRAFGVLGAVSVLACASGCHVAVSPPPQYAPIYTQGPVPIAGEKLEPPPFVRGTDGKPVLVPSLAPGSRMAFPSADTQPPREILVRRHEQGAGGTITEVSPKPVPSPKGVGITFEAPQLPRGIYDAWYVDGRPAAGAPQPLIAPADAKASQSVTFEIKPRLRASRAVVRGTPGSDVDVAIGIAGANPSNPIPITLNGFNSAVSLASSQSEQATTGADGFAHFRVRIASGADVYVAATAPGFSGTAVRVFGAPDHRLRDARLQPGDALLCQGNGIISPTIQKGEYAELGTPNPNGRPWYSHVAVYLGNGETAEMLWDGLIKHELEDTLDGCTTVDVYRKLGLAPAEQQRVVGSIRGYGWHPYAWGQISVIGLVRAIALTEDAERGTELDAERSAWRAFWDGFKLVGEAALDIAEVAALRLAVAEVDALEAGKEMMICSELTAWGYRDAGVKVDVDPWWPDVKKQGLLNSAYGPMDYTTPNMISHSKDMAFRFQLSPAVPPSVTVTGGRIEITEDIEFDTGSATIGKDSEDVLQEVAKVLADHPELRSVRVEGHTDNVGGAAYNKDLSQRRADAVVTWLAAHGVDASRLKSAGVGDARPLVPNDTDANRHRNRRVEFHIEDKTSAAH